MSAAYTTRFLAFYRAAGWALEEQDAARRLRRNVAFIAWVRAHWREWERAHDRAPYGAKSAADHAAFDAWLAGSADAERAA